MGSTDDPFGSSATRTELKWANGAMAVDNPNCTFERQTRATSVRSMPWASMIYIHLLTGGEDT